MIRLRRHCLLKFDKFILRTEFLLHISVLEGADNFLFTLTSSSLEGFCFATIFYSVKRYNEPVSVFAGMFLYF